MRQKPCAETKRPQLRKGKNILRGIPQREAFAEANLENSWVSNIRDSGGKIIPEDFMEHHIVRLWNSRRTQLNYPGKDTATGTHGMSPYSFIA
ncbi:hypothetical protein CDAR_251161 [Caerostris darwini]|uniref:Transposase n=1 Tax=Caerostris darwini TaxID=1538125 RepID=A0AAV4SBG1_9ARAC|nr:hypothetical protein CDAR_251161 [Caerostris darwini]